MDPGREEVAASLKLLKARHRRFKGKAIAAAPITRGKVKEVVVWRCSICEQECIPVREQSRCICGHRLRDHPLNDKLSCARCPCKHFYYIVAEGAWVLRCRCKHKHIDHDPNNKSCKKMSCTCSRFDSPWVCISVHTTYSALSGCHLCVVDCNHPWKDHEQLLVKRRVRTLEEMAAEIGSDLCGARRENSNQGRAQRGG